eukprot:COSAG05_NODE_1104_length_5872_cov_4.990473_8_plen_61_part_00
MRVDYMAWPTAEGGLLIFGGVDVRDAEKARPLDSAADLWLWEVPPPAAAAAAAATDGGAS